jgi:hypothetical protein
MNNVIEHVQHPVRFLQTANGLLKKTGQVYCSTPNGFQDGYFLKTANKRGVKINLLENHFFYYHPKTLARLFKACGFKIQRSYCEDISHALNDFGILPRFKYPRELQNLSLSEFQYKTNREFEVSDNEIGLFKNAPSVKSWRLNFERLKRSLFRIHFPPYLPIGHQQHIFAEKAANGMAADGHFSPQNRALKFFVMPRLQSSSFPEVASPHSAARFARPRILKSRKSTHR